VVGPRISLLIARANAGECDLVAKTHAGCERGYLYSQGMFVADRANKPALTDAALRSASQLPGQETTYTCVPPGSGKRIAIDRDNDNTLDGDEAGACDNDDEQ
jgi:hypothetical protein